MGLFARPAPTPGAPHPPTRAPLRVLRADGQRIDLTSRDAGQHLVATRQPWAATAFGYRDMIGELRYAIRLLSRSVARARFYVAEQRAWPDDPTPLDGADHDLDRQLAADAVHNFARLPMDTNPDGFTARLVENLSITGEGWVHMDTDDRFWVRSTSEVTASADGRVMLSTLPNATAGSQRQIDPEHEELFRMWVPHPEWGQLADSPLRALLDVAEDCVLAGREQRAAARSRVAANGILFISDAMSLVRTRDEDDDADDSVTSDTFMADLTAAMLAPIRDDADSGAVVPIVIRGDRDDIAAARHLTLERADSEQLIERQSAAILRLLRGLDIQPEQVEGIGSANHWCVDHETEILTVRGWLPGNDLVAGDVALTLNHDTGMSEWQPVEHIYRAVVVDEPMVAMGGRRHSSLTTLNHRWPVLRDRGGKNRNVGGEIVDGRHKRREWVTSETLNRQCWIPTAARAGDQPVNPKYTDELVELAAWFWTEGNIGASGGGVTIAQSHTANPLRVERIRACLTRMFGPASTSLMGRSATPRWRESVQRNDGSHGGPITVFRLCREARHALLDVAPDKMVSSDFVRALTPAQLELFIDISAQGDGWHYRLGRLDMWQKNPAALDAYELALILSGRMVSRGESGGGYWVAPHNRGQINPPKASELAVRQGRAPLVTRETYTGTVWCPTTANGTWFARRRGTTFYTGNSAWQIEAQSVRHQVQPMAETVAACLTQAFLRPALLALTHDPAMVERVTIAVDVSPLAENPNRGQDARDAWDRFGISDDALREALGFDDDDAPSEDEFVRRLASTGRLPVAEVAQIFGLAQRDAAAPVTVQGETARPELPSGQRPAAQPGQVIPERATPAEPTNPPTPERAPVVAAAAPSMFRVDADLSRRLADIDAALTERITVAADAAISRVVDRAGARVRSAAHKDRALAGRIGGMDVYRIPAALGRGQVEMFAPVTDLIADGYTRLRGQVDGWLADAAAQVGEVVAQLVGDPTVAEVVVSRLKVAAQQAWPTLAQALDEAAEVALFDPDPVDDGERGESSAGLVSAQDVTNLLAVAGGGTLALTAAADVEVFARGERGRRATGRSRPRRPVRGSRAAPGAGLATGPVVAQVVAEQGGILLGWEWQYRPEILRSTFDPHKQLDGQRFSTWSDPKLDTDEASSWLGQFFRPQDHAGCLCRAAPIFAIADDPDGIVARRLREAAGNPRNILFGHVAADDTAAGRTGTAAQNVTELRARITDAVEQMRRTHIERGGRRR